MSELAETGMTKDQIALVMELTASLSLEARPPVDGAAQRRRERDREYQAQRRAKCKDNLPTSADSADLTDIAPPSPFPNEIKSNPLPHPPAKITRPRKGHRLPDDWRPKSLTGDLPSIVAAWPDGLIERELAKFRDWAASANGPNAIKKDWNAAWRNWLRKVDEGSQNNGISRSPKPQQSGPSGTSPDGIQNPMARVVARRQAERVGSVQ